jgi:hypothetical protein
MPSKLEEVLIFFIPKVEGPNIQNISQNYKSSSATHVVPANPCISNWFSKGAVNPR